MLKQLIPGIKYSNTHNNLWFDLWSWFLWILLCIYFFANLIMNRLSLYIAGYNVSVPSPSCRAAYIHPLCLWYQHKKNIPCWSKKDERIKRIKILNWVKWHFCIFYIMASITSALIQHLHIPIWVYLKS
jgi:hypothetical protein